MSCDVSALIPAPDANKYTRGKLVIMAGSGRYPGAAVLAARASQRMGAGYTEVVTAPPAVDIVRLSSPSLVVHSFDDWAAEQLPASREGKPCAVCIGPGFVPDDPGTAGLVLDVLEHAACPVLVDGGALGALATEEASRIAVGRAFPTVITPHGGEAARLGTGLRVELSARALAEALGAVVVLKGPDTFISDGQRETSMLEGSSALAKAGTGDVLAGMVAALLAQGVEAFEAAVMGATLHARAGNVAAGSLTPVCVTAEDVIGAIPEALRRSL